MSWIIKPPGLDPVSSDDFTLADLIAIEKATGTPWAVLNPFKDGKVAREFYRIALRLSGQDPAEADELTLRVMKSAFDWTADEPFPDVGPGGGDDGPPASRVPHSSGGAHSGSSGSRAKRKNNG